MKRIGIVSENSIDYIKKILEIWENENSVVLIDYRIPKNSILEMLKLAEVELCYTDNFELIEINEKEGIVFKKIEKNKQSIFMVTDDIYNRYYDVISYEDREALVLFSSGTTGKMKGICLSHRAINYNVDSIIDYMNVSNTDIMYVVKSLSHSSALVGELLVALKSKIRLFISTSNITALQVMKNIYKFKISIICLNPTLLYLYTYNIDDVKKMGQSIKKIYVSGAALDANIFQRARECFCNANVLNVYGLTEAGPRVTAQQEPIIDSRNIVSVGKAIKGVKLKITDKTGNEIENGRVGVIHVNTVSIFSKYLKDINKIKDEWLNTGDIGYLDKNQELYVLGRGDDVIITAAHNVYPNEIEQYINEIKEIKNSFVIGIDDILLGKKVICLYEANENNMDKIIRNYCKKKLASYEIPKEFYKVDALPYTVNGKKNRCEAIKLYYEIRKERGYEK